MNDEISILLIDDDIEEFMITKALINKIPNRNYQLEWTSDFDKALDYIKQNKYNLYLVDYKLGARSGVELIKAANNLGCSCPLILLTGVEGSEIDEEAMKAGATDYLTKGKLQAEQLDRVIRYSIQNSRNLNEIKSLNIELENRVEERTLELEKVVKELQKNKEDISRALKKEIELNELKSRFVSTASHEFRTPLSTILSSASLIERYIDSGKTENSEKHIKRIKASVKNLTGILNEFLSLSKLEEGKLQQNFVVFDLVDFTKEILDEMEGLMKKGQKIHYEHSNENSIVMHDKQVYKNILFNLLSNSIKYSEENRNIFIKTDLKNNSLYLNVRDEGIGISNADKKHIFDRFFRAHNVTNTQGTGLGLNIVKKYVEILEGNVNFESELNKGTEFEIQLPLKKK